MLHIHLTLSRCKVHYRKYNTPQKVNLNSHRYIARGMRLCGCSYSTVCSQHSTDMSHLVFFANSTGDGHELLLFSITVLYSISCVCRSTPSLRCIGVHLGACLIGGASFVLILWPCFPFQYNLYQSKIHLCNSATALQLSSAGLHWTDFKIVSHSWFWFFGTLDYGCSSRLCYIISNTPTCYKESE